MKQASGIERTGTKMIALLLGLLATSSPWAGEGSGIIPFWQTDYTTNTAVYITNISGSDVTVKVVLYDQYGNPYDESSESGTQYFGATGAVTSTGTTVAANNSIAIQVKAPNNGLKGYGTISWSSAGSEPVALIANARLQQYATTIDGHAVYPVNNFQPF